MKFQRLLLLAFAAALTVGTSSATTALYTINLSSTNQYLSVSVGGTPVSDYYTNGLVFGANLNVTDAWQSIEIDYTAWSGQNGLTFWLPNYGGYVPNANLASSDQNGISINGLQAAYFSYSGGNWAPSVTDYGEAPINMSAGSGDWSGYNSTSQFKEVLTGYIWTGIDAPDLTQLPGYTTAGGGGTGDPGDPGDNDSAAPEPASWWLMAVALPLMVFSKLRLTRLKTSA